MFTNLKDVSNFLRETQFPLGGMAFDMVREFSYRTATEHPCGSACCIGGWIIARNDLSPHISPAEAVRTIAPDLTPGQAYELCWPDSDSPGWSATPEEAADVIDHLLATGEVDWSRS